MLVNNCGKSFACCLAVSAARGDGMRRASIRTRALYAVLSHVRPPPPFEKYPTIVEIDENVDNEACFTLMHGVATRCVV